MRVASWHDAVVAVHLSDRGVDHEVVREPAGVRQQVADVDRPDRVDERAVGAEHLDGSEGGQVGGDRVLELEAALLVQQHQRGRHDRLGHRVDPKDRVGGHRQVGFPVAMAELLGVNDLPASADHRADADDATFLDVGLHDRSRDGRADSRSSRRLRVTGSACAAHERAFRSLIGCRPSSTA